MRPLLTLFILLILFTGCSHNKPSVAVAPKTLPAWYLDPPRSDGPFLYATGEGVDRQAAVNDALSMLASNLSITIASRYSATATESRRNGQSETAFSSTNEIRSEVEKIRISPYDIVQGREQSFRRYLVLVKADRRAIAKSMEQGLAALLLELENKETALGQSDALKKLFFYRDATEALTAERNKLRIVRLLDPSFDPEPFQAAERAYERRYLQMRNSIRFTLSARSHLAGKLLPVLREGINSLQLNVAGNTADDLFRIEVATRESYTMTMNLYLVRTSITLQTVDRRGDTVNSKTLQLVGQSSQNYAVAEENVGIKLKKLIRKEGILTVLGLTR